VFPLFSRWLRNREADRQAITMLQRFPGKSAGKPPHQLQSQSSRPELFE
jgi:hypothetical protein